MIAHLRSVILTDPWPLRFSAGAELPRCWAASDPAAAAVESDPRNPLRVQFVMSSSRSKDIRMPKMALDRRTHCIPCSVPGQASYTGFWRSQIGFRSEEHMSELQSHSFISSAVLCLKKQH